MRSATPSLATWRSSGRLLRDFLRDLRGTRREHEAVEAMNKAASGEPLQAVGGGDRIFDLAGDLILRPRSLRVSCEQERQDHPVGVG